MAGKVLGFSWVAGAILLIMGAFTFGYVELRAHRLEGYLQNRLELLAPDAPVSLAMRATLQHYASQGLLHAASFDEPRDVEVYARLPKPTDTVRWIFGESEDQILVPFDISQELLPRATDRPAAATSNPDQDGWVIEATIPHEPAPEPPSNWRPTPLLKGTTRESADDGYDIYTWKPPVVPNVTVEILGPDTYDVVTSREIQRIEVVPGHNDLHLIAGAYAALPRPSAKDQVIRFFVPPASVDKIRALPGDVRRIYVSVTGTSQGWLYGASPGSIRIYQTPGLRLDMHGTPIPPVVTADGQPAWPIFHGRRTRTGFQLRGGSDLEHTPVAVFSFRGEADRLEATGGEVPFEMRVSVERSNWESRSDTADQTCVQIRAVNTSSGQTADVPPVYIESNHLAFFSIPKAAVEGGNFDLQVRCVTPGHYLELRNDVITAVAAEHGFAFNLFKSLLIFWLLAMLVAIASVFCSTFVSWPIAVVLTLVLLLGRWGVEMIGATPNSGVGRSIVSQFFADTSPALDKTISSSVEALSSALNTASKFLPDISQFAASQEIDRGANIPNQVVWNSLKVILHFGAPMLVLGYVFLKKKEVAP